jgi:hypothetical protein
MTREEREEALEKVYRDAAGGSSVEDQRDALVKLLAKATIMYDDAIVERDHWKTMAEMSFAQREANRFR